MWRKLVIFACFLVICAAKRNGLVYKKKHHHHHHDAYYHHLFYVGAFVLLKIKFIFVIGMIFTFMMFTGKLFAFMRYIEYSKSDHHQHDHTPEKIYIQTPVIDHHEDHGFISAGGPPTSGGYSPSAGDSLPSFYTQRIYSSIGPRLEDFSHSNYKPGGRSGSNINYNYHSRSYSDNHYNNNTTSIYDNYLLLAKIIRHLNLTDYVFKQMKLEDDNCKRKFICEADINAKHSSILAFGLNMLSDKSYQKYKTQNVESIENCERLYSDCMIEET